MKNGLWILAGILVLTGCGKKDPILGTWTTKYELGMYGEITQTYEFNKNKTCKKILVTDTKIEKECTYEKKDDKIEIKYKEGDSSTVVYRIEDKKIVFDGFTYTKQSKK